VAKSVDVAGGVVDLNRARYFRVYDARGKLLLDVLPERLAKRFQREWNRTRRGASRCRLIRCLVVELER
jgi:hypothetical protein